VNKKTMPITLVIIGLVTGLVIGWLIFGGVLSNTGNAKGIINSYALPSNIVKQADGSTLISLNYKETDPKTGVTVNKKVTQRIDPDNLVYGTLTCTGSCTGENCRPTGCEPVGHGCSSGMCNQQECTYTCEKAVTVEIPDVPND